MKRKATHTSGLEASDDCAAPSSKRQANTVHFHQPIQPRLQSRLLSLPGEMRNQICAQVFAGSEITILLSRIYFVDTDVHLKLVCPEKYSRGWQDYSALLHTCRQLLREAQPILFAETRFVLNDKDSRLRFLDNDRAAGAFFSKIRHLHVYNFQLELPILDYLRFSGFVSLRDLEIEFRESISYDLDVQGIIRRDTSSREAIEHARSFLPIDIRECISNKRRDCLLKVYGEFDWSIFIYDQDVDHDDDDDSEWSVREEGYISTAWIFSPGDSDGTFAVVCEDRAWYDAHEEKLTTEQLSNADISEYDV